ncbi:DUF4406 domain-containing protein [Aeromonas hydrophila]|uniref:DUF4406 domain-containing protein n=1 Tax=Aeromonas hydrophila TaxID=644 RepID=UPI00237855BC|nr:DUF4406 domain-containing protein [Aeromonas hydrophila]MDD9228923.1 DUF4406 domain-containing protein [Aeromonas hydrophila]
MAKIYIAGPMTGLPNFNRDAFRHEAKRLQSAGHATLASVFLPAFVEPHKREAIMFSVDQVVMLPGWESCPQATAERDLAIKLGKPIVPASPEDEEVA